MILTCIVEYRNRVDKYLCLEVCADRPEGSREYRFTNMADIEKLVEISGLDMHIGPDYYSGYVSIYLVRPDAPRSVATATDGEVFLVNVAAQELRAVSRSFFEQHYKVIGQI